jgi:hypothetical protein
VKLASAIAACEERFIARHVEFLRAKLADGRSLFYAFDREDGTCTRVDVLGPKGMVGGEDGGGLFVAPVPTVRLWSPGSLSRPLAVAAANRAFPEALDALAERARPLVGDEHRVLLALLATVRDHAPRLRPRVPKVGTAITSSGTPSLAAFASCLGLGDVEESILKAVA